MGKPLHVLVQFDEADAMSAHLSETLRRHAPVATELAFSRKSDGAHVLVHAASTPVAGIDGSAVACRTAFTDVTEQNRLVQERAHAVERERLARETLERARESAEQANRLKDEFLSLVSHELRTPLNAILGWSHILTSPSPGDAAKVQRGLHVIRRNAEAQQRLVEDILDVSRIITGKLRIEMRDARLAESLRACVESMQPTAAAKGLSLQVEIHGDPHVVVDAERIQQVVSNLLSNAIKFTPAGGRIGVRLDADDDTATVRVRDTGVGIEPDALPWIFDRFRQVDSSPSRLHGGLGLGLAIARYIVELHGGRIRGESAGPGHGAEFIMDLPVAQPASGSRQERPSVAPPPVAEARLSGLRILVVDDNEDARLMTAELLNEEGAMVTVAASALEAIRAAADHAPHVLVSDSAMPGGDGFWLLSRLRAMPAPAGRVRALALTAYSGADQAEACRLAGYDEHMAKPMVPSVFVDVVARLGRRSLRAGG